MKEKAQNYFTVIGFLFLFEGINQSLLYPIGPLLLADKSYLEDQNAFGNQEERISSHNDPFQNQIKGQLCIYFSFYLLIFYLFQFIGMFFWSSKVDQINVKYCIVMMVVVNTLTMITISMKVSLALTLCMRAIQGFFTSPIGIIKLTFDNKFNPRRDMQKIVDYAGLWFIGLALGSSATGILSNPQDKFSPDLSEIIVFKSYPFLLPFIFNSIVAIILIIIVFVMFPKENDKKKQYKKMQGTMFFQSIFFLSQNDFTYVITRHQRTRETFDRMLLKKILWKDRNFLFAIIHQSLLYVVFFGLFDNFTLYCVTVLDIRNELFISIAQSMALFCVFVYEILGMDVNFFERNGILRKGTKDLTIGWLICLISVALLYLIRTLQYMNNYFFLVIVCMTHILFCVSFCHLMSINNYLIEQTALQCKDDSDHARNIAQFIGSLSKLIGPFSYASFAAFNYWQITNIYLGNNTSTQQHIDFIYAFTFCGILICFSFLILSCLDKNWKQPEQDEEYTTKKLIDAEVISSGNEVFA